MGWSEAGGKKATVRQTDAVCQAGQMASRADWGLRLQWCSLSPRSMPHAAVLDNVTRLTQPDFLVKLVTV